MNAFRTKRKSVGRSSSGGNGTPRSDKRTPAPGGSVELNVQPGRSSALFSKQPEDKVPVPSRKRVYTCLVSEATDPSPPKEFPMYIAMANLCITPTGFTDNVTRDSICSKIQLMCGEVSMAYTNKTTHLLAAHANTNKVDLARERNLKVVTENWIEDIWNACQQNNPYIHASLPQFQNSECPLFHNLKFVFSKRYDLDTKQLYERLLLTNGGIIGNSLKKAANYFYICQEPETEQAYCYAQSKEIPCIPLAWIIESINRNTLAKVHEFEVRGKELAGFGTTFDVGEVEPGSLPMPNYPAATDTFACSSSYYQSSKGNHFDPGSDLDAMDTDFTVEETLTSTLLGDTSNRISDSAGCDEKMDESGSYLEDTIIAADQSSKSSLADSLTFTVAG